MNETAKDESEVEQRNQTGRFDLALHGGMGVAFGAVVSEVFTPTAAATVALFVLCTVLGLRYFTDEKKPNSEVA